MPTPEISPNQPEAAAAAHRASTPQEKSWGKEQFREIDWSQYEATAGTSDQDVVRYYQNKTNPEDRLLRLDAPDFDFPVIVRLPERKNIEGIPTETWAENQHKVMLDENTLWLVAQIMVRYNRRQPLIIEGPPAVSKTFVVWVVSLMLEQPYWRVNFSQGTKEGAIWGGRVPEVQQRYRPDIKRFIYSMGINRKVEDIIKRQEANQPITENERDTVMFVNLVREILDMSESGSADPVFVEAELMSALQLLQPVIKTDLIFKEEFAWKDSNFTRVIEKGGIATLDEPNLADPGVLDSMLPLLEVNTTSVPMPAARGYNLQKHPDAMIISTQNPPNVGARNPLTDAYNSRNEHIELQYMTEEYVVNVLTFFMTGNDPDIRIGNKLRKGRQNIETAYRGVFDNVPARDAIIKTIAKVHMQLGKFVAERTIGKKRNDGGDYVFDQRDIAGILDSMINTVNRGQVKEINGQLVPVQDIDWIYVLKRAFEDVYLSGLPGDATEGDYKIVQDYLDELPIWKLIRRQGKNFNAAVDINVNVQQNSDGSFTPDW